MSEEISDAPHMRGIGIFGPPLLGAAEILIGGAASLRGDVPDFEHGLFRKPVSTPGQA
jgi:hypothetical protein